MPNKLRPPKRKQDSGHKGTERKISLSRSLLASIFRPARQCREHRFGGLDAENVSLGRVLLRQVRRRIFLPSFLPARRKASGMARMVAILQTVSLACWRWFACAGSQAGSHLNAVRTTMVRSTVRTGSKLRLGHGAHDPPAAGAGYQSSGYQPGYHRKRWPAERRYPAWYPRKRRNHSGYLGAAAMVAIPLVASEVATERAVHVGEPPARQHLLCAGFQSEVATLVSTERAKTGNRRRPAKNRRRLNFLATFEHQPASPARGVQNILHTQPGRYGRRCLRGSHSQSGGLVNRPQIEDG
jgi:hypothetical protein